MVGKRSIAPDDRSRPSTANSRYSYTSTANGSVPSPPSIKRRFDLEANTDVSQPRPNVLRFRDAANNTITDNRRHSLKKALLEKIELGGMEKWRMSKEELHKLRNKKLRRFYEQQNERLNDWMEVDTVVLSLADDVIDSMNPDPDHDGIPENQGEFQGGGEDLERFLPDEERKKRSKAERNARLAINVNVVANIVLVIAKIFAAFYSSSLSLIASLVDSALDLLCTLIVWSTNRLVQWRLHSLKRRFPVGRRRLEPLGILVFSIIMVISFLQILQESIQKLLPTETPKKAVELPPLAVCAMIGTIVLKGIIWFGCKPIRTTQVQALAQDCKTDVYFNIFSLLFPLIGSRSHVWWLDPVGAAILSLYIIYDWAETCFENVTRLSGSAISDDLQRKLIYLAYRFSPLVDGFKKITAYHAGDGVWVEMDMLLDEKTPLHRSHDVSETLQYCCEGLKEVDRAFVTTDYTVQGPTGHAANNQ